jgi:nucleoside-diphosphate-sugar epimerase
MNQFTIKGLDLPTYDLRNYETCLNELKDQDAVIHLAWNVNLDCYSKKIIHEDNMIMLNNIYKASKELKVKRVIMASSVHADSYLESNG